MKVAGAVVVITGASSGIGRATALTLANGGAHLVLAARHEPALTTLAHTCVGRGAPAAIAIPTDVADPKAVTELAQRTIERLGRIDVWINNAAVTMYSPFVRTPLRDLHRIIEVNLLGYVHGARAALPQMRAQGWGTLINVGSLNAIFAAPYSATYSMSKAAIRSFGASLRSELQLDGFHDVHVCTVMFPSVDTPIYQHAANYTGRAVQPIPPVYSPQRAARAITHLIRAPRRELIVGCVARSAVTPHLLAPGLTERLFAKQVDQTQFAQEAAPDTQGNLHEPATDAWEGLTSGGWSTGRSLRRSLIGAGLLTGGWVLAQRLRRTRLR